MLTNNETLLLFHKLKTGNLLLRNHLVEENLGFVGYIVKKYKNTKVDLSELFSVGTLGLIKAVDSFDESRNVLFATYASRCIENEILLFLKKNKKWKCYIRMDVPVCYNGMEKEVLLQDTLASEEYLFSKFELECTYEEIRYVLGKLTDRDRQVILLYFGFLNDYCYSQKEISNILGISQSFVSRVIKKSLCKLKVELLSLEKISSSKKVFTK